VKSIATPFQGRLKGTTALVKLCDKYIAAKLQAITKQSNNAELAYKLTLAYREHIYDCIVYARANSVTNALRNLLQEIEPAEVVSEGSDGMGSEDGDSDSAS
jgi:hypothetical protein